MKRLKKFTALLLLAALIVYPFQALACPHFDEHGRMYFLIYNEDFTRATFIYYLENHLHHQEVLMDNLFLSDTITREAFEFPILRYGTFVDQLEPPMGGYDDYKFSGNCFIYFDVRIARLHYE